MPKPPGIVRRDYPTVDGFRASEIYFENVAIPGDALLAGGIDLIERIVDEATIAVCAEATGVMAKLHEGTVDYTKQRQQFGQPIARFQVLQHRMVDMFMEVEQAKSMTLMATLKLDQPAIERMAAVSQCKAKVSRGANFVGQNADPDAWRHRDHAGTGDWPLFQARNDDRKPVRQCRFPFRPV